MRTKRYLIIGLSLLAGICCDAHEVFRGVEINAGKPVSDKGITVSATGYELFDASYKDGEVYVLNGKVARGSEISITARYVPYYDKPDFRHVLRIRVYRSTKKSHMFTGEYFIDETREVVGGPVSVNISFTIGGSLFDNAQIDGADVDGFSVDVLADTYRPEPLVMNGKNMPEHNTVKYSFYVLINDDLDSTAVKRYDTEGISGIVDIEDEEGDGDTVIDTAASEEAGERGWVIPAAIASVVVLGATALRKNKKKKDRKEEDEKKSTYELRIRKDFGDTLIPGSAPEKVFAKVVRISADGKESAEPGLSAKIKIAGDSYLKVGNQHLAGEYMSATVEAPERKDPPKEAVVSFQLFVSGRTFTNRMHFRIASPQIFFGQDNLTIPAVFDETIRLPFVVEGMDNAKVSARVSDGAYGSPDYRAYSVETEFDAEENLHYALITEKVKEITGEAGDYRMYNLIVTAKDGETVVEESLPIFRYNMGLRLTLDNIECFPDVETKAKLTLYDYDLEQHKLLVWAPGLGKSKGDVGSPDNPVITDYRIIAKDQQRQELVERLHIVCDVRNALESGRSCVFFPKDAFLDPPTRLETTVSITVNCGERTYTVDKPVLLTSQPVREFSAEASKSDERISDGLRNIYNQIYNQHFVSQLFPVLKLIDTMQDGYDPKFGYDAGQVQAVKDIYMGFLNGDIVGANGTARMVTLGDEMRMFMSSFVQTVEETQNSLGSAKSIMARLALGYFTAGASEVVFQGFDLVCNGVEMGKGVVEAVENGQDKATAVFCVGAKIMFREAFWDQAGKKIGAGLSKEAERLRQAGFTKANLKKAGSEMLENAGFFSGKKGKIALNAIDDNLSASSKAAVSGKSILQLPGGKALNPEDLELQRAFQHNQALAKENLENLRSAMDLYKMNPTAANLKLRNEYIVKCQQSKSMMYHLQNYSDTGLDSVRKEFNSVMGDFHKGATDLTIVDLSARHGIPPGQIKQFKATSASKAKVAAGKKLPIDNDTTLYWEKPDGSIVYFDEDEVRAIYDRHLYKESLGFDAADSSFERRFAGKMDSTVIEDIAGNAESYGVDVNRMTQASLHGTELKDPRKVAEAVRYKMKHWFAQGDDLMKQARSAVDTAERESLMQMAEEKYREGLRQGTKIFDNCTNPRDVARVEINGGSRIDQKLRTAVEISRAASDPVAPRSSVDIERSLEQLGYTRESFADACGDMIEIIG